MAFFFNACGSSVSEEDLLLENEKQRFISATAEVTCTLMKTEDVSEYIAPENRPRVNEQINAIFKKHGFDTDDVEYMEAVTAKYGSDDEVYEEIGWALQDC